MWRCGGGGEGGYTLIVTVTDWTCYSPEARHMSNCPVLTDKSGCHRESVQHQWRMKTWRDPIWNSFESGDGGGSAVIWHISDWKLMKAKVFISGHWTLPTVIENFVNIAHLGENLTNLRHLFYIFIFGGLGSNMDFSVWGDLKSIPDLILPLYIAGGCQRISPLWYTIALVNNLTS